MTRKPIKQYNPLTNMTKEYTRDEIARIVELQLIKGAHSVRDAIRQGASFTEAMDLYFAYWKNDAEKFANDNLK